MNQPGELKLYITSEKHSPTQIKQYFEDSLDARQKKSCKLFVNRMRLEPSYEAHSQEVVVFSVSSSQDLWIVFCMA